MYFEKQRQLHLPHDPIHHPRFRPRLPDGAGDHEVDCKTDQGAFMLKAEFLKKA